MFNCNGPEDDQEKANNDNHSNQMNSNNGAYWDPRK